MENSSDIIEKLVDCYDRELSPSLIFSSEDMERLVSDSDSEVRAWLAKALVMDSCNVASLKILCRLSSDPDPDVRVEAIDSLGEYICVDSLNVLTKALKDSDSLVRGYAAFGVSNVGRIIDPTGAKLELLTLEQKEEEEFVLVGIYEGLHLLGEKLYLEKLFSLFCSSDYRIQCAVIHSLENVLTEDNAEQIGCFINKNDFTVYPKAVKCAIESLNSKCTAWARL